MAGLIPQPFIDDLLERVDIVEVIDRRVKLKKSGKNYSARCPFHEEKTPSFSVSPDKQFYYCFGCGASGNAIGFVMEYENLEFPQAVESLAGGLGLEVPRERQAGARSGGGEEGHRELLRSLESAANFYKQQLRQHPQAQRAVAYLKGRGLTGRIASEYDLGFAPPGWDNLLQAFAGDEKSLRLLEQGGMLVRNEAGRVYDRFRDRVIFPIRDSRGRIVAFGGRVLGDDKPKYLNSPETPVFHKGRELYGLYQARRAERRLERLLVVEGYMDVIALAQHGIRNAVATLGTATSVTHLQRIFRLCPEVVFCFDGDEAGRKAAARALESVLPCMEDGRQARFLFLPEGEDPDSLVRRRGAEGFDSLLREARPLETFLFDSVAKGVDVDSLEGRARLSRLALPLLQQLPQGVYRELMMQSLATRAGVDRASLAQLEAAAAPPEPTPPPAPQNDAPSDRQGDGPRRRPALASATAGHGSLAQSAIALLLHRPEMAREVGQSELAELEGSDAALLRDLLALLKRRPGTSTAALLGHWYGTPEGELLGRLAGQERLIPSEGIEQQFRDTLAELSRVPHRARLAEQVDKLRAANYAQLSEAEKQTLRDLLKQKQALDSERGGRGK